MTRLDQRVFEFIAAAIGRTLLRIELALKMHSEAADDVWSEQTVPQAGQSPLFKMVAGDRAVATRLPIGSLAPPPTADADEIVAADAAAHPTAEKNGSLGASKWISDEAEVHVPSRAGFRLASLTRSQSC